MRVTFTESGFKEYIEWQQEDKKTLKRINELIKSIQRDGFMKGIGKPEALKGRKECSRRIDDTNRLVYTGDRDMNLVIVSCKGHYED
ncbi:MAG: Txe/YoeB family addiction module toxin [Chitinispirillales bacterium]|jgi:toxin YoeB|nr:Txe/YoeB family addiction module toxin [Chitinispirillales bacterium]